MNDDAAFVSGVVDNHRLFSVICDASDLMLIHEDIAVRELNLVVVELEARTVRLGDGVDIGFLRDVEQPDIVEELSFLTNAADDDDLFPVEEVEAEEFARHDLGEDKQLKSGFFVG